MLKRQAQFSVEKGQIATSVDRVHLPVLLAEPWWQGFHSKLVLFNHSPRAMTKKLKTIQLQRIQSQARGIEKMGHQ